MIQITVQLDDRHATALDDAARELGGTRSGLLRELIGAVLDNQPDLLMKLEPPARKGGRKLGGKNKPKPIDAAAEMC